jgi:hypothetical protein
MLLLEDRFICFDKKTKYTRTKNNGGEFDFNTHCHQGQLKGALFMATKLQLQCNWVLNFFKEMHQILLIHLKDQNTFVLKK